MTRAFAMTVGLACLLIAALPHAAAAQEIHACAPNAPGVWCVKLPAGPWANLDFGLREQIGDPNSIWVWKVHHLWMEVVPPAAIDCKMAKPADPAIDPRMVVPPPSHFFVDIGHSQVGAAWFAPCKSK